MTTQTFRRRLATPVSILACLFLLISCSEVGPDPAPEPDNSPCGEKKEEVLFFSQALGKTPARNYIKDGKRYFQWTSAFYENVCPLEHIVVETHFHLKKHPSGKKVEIFNFGRYGLYEPQIPHVKTEALNDSIDVRFYNGNFGIKNLFGEEPGNFQMYYEIVFETLGDFDQDWAFLKEVWVDINTIIDYREPK